MLKFAPALAAIVLVTSCVADVADAPAVPLGEDGLMRPPVHDAAPTPAEWAAAHPTPCNLACLSVAEGRCTPCGRWADLGDEECDGTLLSCEMTQWAKRGDLGGFAMCAKLCEGAIN